MHPTDRARPFTPALLLVALLVLIGVGGPAENYHGFGGPPGPGARSPAFFHGAAGTAVSAFARPSSAPPVTGSTAQTLVLFNGSKIAGNFIAANPARPIAILYDSPDDTAWVSAQSYVGGFGGSSNAGVVWIQVGNGAAQLALDNRTDSLLVSNSASNTVSVVNTTSDQVVQTVSVETGPQGIAYDYLDDSVFVANSGNGTVSVINATSWTTTSVIPVGKHPVGVAFDGTDHRLFVANSLSHNISVINTTNLTAYRNISIVPSTPTNLVFDPALDRLYATGFGGGTEVINAGTFATLTTLHEGLLDTGLALDSNGATLFVTDASAGIVYPVNTTTNVAGLTFGVGSSANPVAVAYVSSQKSLFVANSPVGSTVVSNLTVASTSTSPIRTTGAIALQHFPSATVAVPTRHSVYVYDGGSGEIFELNSTTLSVNRSAFVGYSPGGLALPNSLAYDATDQQLWVGFSSTASTKVAIVSARTMNLLQVRPVGLGPAGIVFDAAVHEIFVVDHGSNNVTVLDTISDLNVASIGVGGSPTAAVLDPVNGEIYVSNSATDNVSVINASSRTVSTIAVGSDPLAITYDAGLDRIVVANAGGGNLTVIDPSTDRSVASAALPGPLVPTQVYYDAANGTLDVTEWLLAQPVGSLVILNDTNLSMAAAFPIAPGPVSIVYDPDSGTTLVASETTGVLSDVQFVVPPVLSIRSFTTPFSTINLGDPTAFTVVAAGGQGPFSYVYYGLPPGCSSNNSSFIACFPNATGSFTVWANVTDTLGEFANASAPLTVLPAPPPPLSVNLTATPPRIALGNSSTLTTNATGGQAPYTYWYSALPAGCASANTSSVVCQPSQIGNYSLQVRVNDSSGNITVATGWLNVTANGSVNPPPTLVLGSFTASPAHFALGGATTLNATVSGGVLPYSFLYSGLPTGCTSQDRAAFTCTPSTMGNYTVTVQVTDAHGSTVQGRTNLSVTSPGNGSTPRSGNSSSGIPTWELAILVLVVIAVLAGLAALFLRDRSKKPPTTETPAEDGAKGSSEGPASSDEGAPAK